MSTFHVIPQQTLFHNYISTILTPNNIFPVVYVPVHIHTANTKGFEIPWALRNVIQKPKSCRKKSN